MAIPRVELQESSLTLNSSEGLIEEEEEEVLLPDTTIITHCIYKNDLDRLLKSFEDDTDPYHSSIGELINERDDEGKTPLDLCSCYGRVDICRELLKKGAEVQGVSEKGYTAMHYAAAWGHVAVLKTLVEYGANIRLRTLYEERPREIAERYNQEECIDFLDWAEAKANLADTIKSYQEMIMDGEKVASKGVTKPEKTLVLAVCKEKSEWLESTQDPVTQDFIAQRQTLEETLAPVIQKMTEPQHKKGSKRDLKKIKSNFSATRPMSSSSS